MASVELDWWQETQHHSRPDIIIACVPAMVSSDVIYINCYLKSMNQCSLYFILLFCLSSIGVDLGHLLKRTGLSGAAMWSKDKMMRYSSGKDFSGNRDNRKW